MKRCLLRCASAPFRDEAVDGIEESEMFGLEHSPANTSCSPSWGGGELCDLAEEKRVDEGRSDTSYPGIIAKLFVVWTCGQHAGLGVVLL